MSCHLRLFGEVVLETVTGGYSLGTGKARMLLVYLAYQRDRVRRETLSALLWPETPEAKARANLRQLLHTVRRASFIEALTINESWLFWPVPTDVADFWNAVQGSDWTTALTLYRGALLSDLTGTDSSTFDDWLVGEREAIALAYRNAAFARVSELQHDPAAAAQPLAQLLNQDPFDEDALAARLELLSRAGQVRLAQDEYERYRKRLAREFGEMPSGVLTELVEGLRVAPSERLALPQTPSPPPQSNPPPLSAFVGRTHERAQVLRRLSAPECRLLTLVGPGGIGKTRLALEILAEAKHRFRDGVLFIPLETVAGPRDLVPALAAGLGLPLEADGSPVAQLTAHLAASERLLVLDNFEELVEAREVLAGLLRGAAGIKLLVTSRERLGLPQEEVFDLFGLTLPRSEGHADLEASEAAQLFLHGARRAGAPMPGTTTARRALFDICTQVGGMPLALELTSAWLRLLHVEEIAAELGTGIDLLVDPGSALPERHRSLRVVLDQSWARLSETERTALAGLSVFRGGITYAAGRAITGMSIGTLLGLVNRSLLYRSPNGRLSLHELVRQYAAERLQRMGLADEVPTAHAQYYLELLGKLEMWSEHEPASLATLDLELDNVRAAWRWAVIRGQLPALLPKNDVVVYFDRRMRFLEGLELLEAASALYSPAAPKEREMLASLSTDRAWLLFRLARYTEAEAFALRTLELSETAKTRMKAFNTLGIITRQQGRYEEAASHIEGALRLAQELGETARVAAYLNNLAATYNELARYDRAEAASRAALNLHHAADDTYGIVTTLLDMTIMRMALEDFTRALDTVDEALALAHEADFDDALLVLMLTRAQVLYRLGELEVAKTIGHELLLLTQQPGHTPNRVMTFNLLGRIAVLQHELTQARRYLTQGFLLAWRHKDTPTILENIVATAELELCEKQHERAYKLLSAALGHMAALPSTRRDAEKLLRFVETTRLEVGEAALAPLELWLPAFLGLV